MNEKNRMYVLFDWGIRWRTVVSLVTMLRDGARKKNAFSFRGCDCTSRTGSDFGSRVLAECLRGGKMMCRNTGPLEAYNSYLGRGGYQNSRCILGQQAQHERE
jgi:hypothetical protein